jgi:hypothetical protein
VRLVRALCRPLRAAARVAAAVAVAAALAAPLALVAGVVHRPRPAAAASLGNSACGSISASPTSGVTGGYTYDGRTVPPTTLQLSITWNGSPSNSGCTTNTNSCPTAFGSCPGGYWLVGLFCSTLVEQAISQGNLAQAQDYCDLNNIIDLTDDNSGPNDPPDNAGTSYNTCSTEVTLANFGLGSLPGTVYCVADGAQSDGWSENWPQGATTGTASGPVEETSSSTPFSPATTSATCPPSQANIAAGALPDTCAFVVLEVDLTDSCYFFVCNIGSTSTNSTNYLAVTFTYQQSTPGPLVYAPSTVGPGDVVGFQSSGWGPAADLSTTNGLLEAQVCGLGGNAASCSATASVIASVGGTGLLTGVFTVPSTIGGACASSTCFVELISTQTQVENGWIGPQDFAQPPWSTDQTFGVTTTASGEPSVTVAAVPSAVGATVEVTGDGFDPFGGPVHWYLKNPVTGATYPDPGVCSLPVAGQPVPAPTPLSATVNAKGQWSGSVLLNLCGAPAAYGGGLEVVATQETQSGIVAGLDGQQALFSSAVAEGSPLLGLPLDDQASYPSLTLAPGSAGSGTTYLWRLNEPSGTTAFDSYSGNIGIAHGGVTPGVAGPPGVQSSAWAFDGSTGYVSTTDLLDAPPNLTISAWFRTTPGGSGVIVGYDNSDGPAPTDYDRLLYVGADGHLVFGVCGSSCPAVVESANPVNDGNWHHVVATLSATSGLTLSVDGSTTTNAGATTAQAFSGYWVLGTASVTGWPDPPASPFFSGDLADVSVTYPPVANAPDADGNGAAINGGVTLGAAGPFTSGVADPSPGATSFSFNGSTGYVNTNSSYANPETFSIAVWFKAAPGSTSGPIVAFGSSQGTGSANYDRLLYIGSDGHLVFGVCGSSCPAVVESANPVNDGNWHFAVATLSSAGLALFVDGQPAVTNTSVTNAQNYTGYWHVGYSPLGGWPDSNGSANAYFDGSVADVEIYPGALAPAQVSALYATSQPPPPLAGASASFTYSGPVTESEDTPTYQAAVLAGSPVGYWQLNDPPGSASAQDSSGNFDLGTYSSGVTLGQPGPLYHDGADTSAAFNGSSGDVTTAQQFPGPQTFSIGLWFKTSTPGGLLAGFSSTGAPSSPGLLDRLLYVGADGHLVFTVDDGGTTPVAVESPAAVDDGSWHQAVATFSSATGMALYLDGNLVATDPSVTSISSFVGYWLLGGVASLSGLPDAPADGFFSGDLAQVAVTPTVLPGFEVSAQFGFSRSDALYRQAVLNLDPRADWPLAESSGATVTDVSSRGLDGTYSSTGVTLGVPGPVTANGDLDTAAAFSAGGGGRADLPSPFASVPQAASLVVWFRTSGSGPLVSAASCAAPCTPASSAPLLWVGTGGRLHGSLSTSPGAAAVSAFPVDDGHWHFAVVTAGPAGTALYLDGVEVASTAAGPALAGLSSWALATLDPVPGTTWPGLPSAPADYYGGSLADVAVYPAALSPSEVALLFSAGTTSYGGLASVQLSPVTLGLAEGVTAFGILQPVGVTNLVPAGPVSSTSCSATTTSTASPPVPPCGWSLTASFSSPDFTNQLASGNSADNEIPVSDLAYAPTGMTVAGATVEGLAGASPAALGGFSPFPQSGAVPICSVAGPVEQGYAVGAYGGCGAVLELTVPGWVAAGSYSDTLLLTLS